MQLRPFQNTADEHLELRRRPHPEDDTLEPVGLRLPRGRSSRNTLERVLVDLGRPSS